MAVQGRPTVSTATNVTRRVVEREHVSSLSLVHPTYRHTQDILVAADDPEEDGRAS
jgi:hypothetical protein